MAFVREGTRFLCNVILLCTATYGSAQDAASTKTYFGDSPSHSVGTFTSDERSNSPSGSTSLADSTKEQASTSTRPDREVLLESANSKISVNQTLPPTCGFKTFWLGVVLAAVLFFSAIPRVYDPKTGEEYSMSENLADFNRLINKHLPAKMRLNPVVAISAVAAVLAVVGLGELVRTAYSRHKAKSKAGAIRSRPRLRGIELLLVASVALFLALWIQPNPAISMTRGRNTGLAIAAATGAVGLFHLLRSLSARSAFAKPKESAFRATDSELLDKEGTGDMQENPAETESLVISPTPVEGVFPQKKEASN